MVSCFFILYSSCFLSVELGVGLVHTWKNLRVALLKDSRRIPILLCSSCDLTCFQHFSNFGHGVLCAAFHKLLFAGTKQRLEIRIFLTT
jgi:hypothetical protein